MAQLPTTRTPAFPGARQAHANDHNELHRLHNMVDLLPYVHNQSSASTEWVIDHNLGFHPTVHVEDSSGRLMHGAIEYQSNARLVITFSAAFAGTAYLTL